jgi:hypothetical protein
LYPSKNEIRILIHDVDVDEEFLNARNTITLAPSYGNESTRSLLSPTETRRTIPRNQDAHLSESRKKEGPTTGKGSPLSVAPETDQYSSPGSSSWKLPPHPGDRLEVKNSSRHFVSPEPTKPRRVQIEVSPGEFMNLRGADETADAIEKGRSRIVYCFSCGIGLRCVPDCELVICPDCRIMSPVPQKPATLMENDDSGGNLKRRTGIPRCPSIWQEEETNDHCIGGVGLGLRI